jgi:hypothetical protein
LWKPSEAIDLQNDFPPFRVNCDHATLVAESVKNLFQHGSGFQTLEVE